MRSSARNTMEKFGPVHAVKPELVFELAFEGIQRSPRHRSGIAVRFPRMARWRTDKKAEDADTHGDHSRAAARDGRIAPSHNYNNGHADQTTRQQRYGNHAHRHRRVGHGRRRLGVRLGTAGRRRIRSRPSTPRWITGINWIDTAAVYGLGHSEEVVARALEGRSQPALRLHQMRARVERAAARSASAESRIHPPRMRSQPAAAEGGRHRPVPDPLAGAGRGHRGRLDGAWRKLQREGKVRWIGVSNFNVQPDGARRKPSRRSLRCSRPTRRSRRRSKRRFCPTAQAEWHRRDRVFAHEIGPAHRRHDARAHRRLSGRRFPPAHAAFPGAAA